MRTRWDLMPRRVKRPGMLAGGDGSTLSLDFTAMSGLDSRFTFTRASTTSTFINSSGLVATAGTNVARFDYDPTTLAPRGLLIEGSATNELLRSNAFNTSPWTLTNFNTPTIASPAVTDPSGGTDTWYGVPSGTGNVFHGFRYIVTFTAAAYTFSIWAKAAQHDKFIISDLTTGTGACRFDLTAKTATVIAGTVTPTNPQIVPYPNGWFRCSFTMQMSAITTGLSWSSYPTGATINSNGAIFTATGTDGMYFYGAQLELGSGATSYIPTGASTVQRATDSCSMTGTNFSSWYPAGTTSGTFFCQFDNSRSNLGFSINPTPIALGEYSAGNLIAGLMNTTAVGSGATISVWGSGGSGLQQSPIGATISQGNKIAFAFNGQTATGSLNGGSGTATTTGTVNAKTILFIGGSGSGTSVVRDFIVAPIQMIKFFPSVFSTAQLQSLTQ